MLTQILTFQKQNVFDGAVICEEITEDFFDYHICLCLFPGKKAKYRAVQAAVLSKI